VTPSTGSELAAEDPASKSRYGDRETAENERLHPGFHDRMHRQLNSKFPGPGVVRVLWRERI
jgi:hypothetical protein